MWPDPKVSVAYQPLPVYTARGAQRSQWRVEQPLPNRRTLRLQGEVADASAAIAVQEAAAFADDLAWQIQETYYALYRVQELDRLIRAFQEELNEFAEAAAVRYEVGVGMQQAILKAQLERNSLAVRRARLAETRYAALETLRYLLARPDTLGLTGPLAAPPLAAMPADLDPLTQRPEAEALRLAEQRAGAQIALARQAFWPAFTVSLTYFDLAEAEVPPTATGRDALMVGVALKVPLFRDGRRARVEEARLERQQAAARYEAFALDLATQAEALAARLRQQQQQLTLLDATLIPQAETTREATLSAYTTGRTDFLDLLDAERMLFTLHTERIETWVRHLQTHAHYRRVLGLPFPSGGANDE